MYKLDKLEIKNFKFFDNAPALDLNGQNILLYGENGSGKSTIYWALYTLLQSSIKEDENIQKYFDKDGKHSLVNSYADEDDSKVSLWLKDEEDVFTISKDIITIKETNLIKQALYTSDFINYKYLFRFFDFLHKDDIDLFALFEYEVLHFLLKNGKNLSDMWKAIVILEKGKPRVRKNRHEYRDLRSILRTFSGYLESLVEDINIPADEYLNSFDYNDITIKLSVIAGTYDKQVLKKPQVKLKISININGEMVEVSKPQSYFNEAKLTAIALSVRFAITKIKFKESELKLLVLDDLLVSLDMSNRNKVLNVLLNDEDLQKYQKIILTHDRSFFEMAKHKFNYAQEGKWKYFEMYVDTGDTNEKPFITKSLSYLEKAEKYLVKKEYEVAGNFLRKEAENFCKSFLPKKCHFSNDCSPYMLNSLIEISISYAKDAGLSDTLFKKLNEHREFVLNSTSHDSYDVPKYKQEIKDSLETLKELRKIEIRPFLQKGETLEFEVVDKNESDVYKFEIQLEDDFRLFKIGDDDTVISKGMVNYWIIKNGTYLNGTKSNSLTHKNITLKKLYEDTYKTSNMKKSNNFWEEIIIQKNREKINRILK